MDLKKSIPWSSDRFLNTQVKVFRNSGFKDLRSKMSEMPAKTESEQTSLVSWFSAAEEQIPGTSLSFSEMNQLSLTRAALGASHPPLP